MDVDYYKYHFSRLHTAKVKGRLAPHKAVLLIAVMRLVERGVINSPEIELLDELVAEFKSVWEEKVPASCPFSCSIGQPFFHMQHEPFWRLLEYEEDYNIVAEELGLYTNETKEMPGSYSTNAIRKKFRCAMIDRQLYEVLSDADNRKILEDILVKKYLTYDPPHNYRKSMTAVIGAALFFAA